MRLLILFILFKGKENIERLNIDVILEICRKVSGNEENVLYELLELLLLKLNSEDTRLPLADKMSSVTLFLLTKLREQKSATSILTIDGTFCSDFF